MTYYAVENYLRKFKRDAKDLKAQAEGREAAAPSPARPKVNKKIASPTKGGVKTGRVSKKKPVAKVKKEVVEKNESEGEEMVYDQDGFGGMELGDIDDDLELGEA